MTASGCVLVALYYLIMVALLCASTVVTAAQNPEDRRTSAEAHPATTKKPMAVQLLPPEEVYSPSDVCRRMLRSGPYTAYMWNAARSELGLPAMNIATASISKVNAVLDHIAPIMESLSSNTTDTAAASTLEKMSSTAKSAAPGHAGRKLTELPGFKGSLRESNNANNLQQAKIKRAFKQSSQNFLRKNAKPLRAKVDIGQLRNPAVSSARRIPKEAVSAAAALRKFYGLALGCTAVPIFDTVATYVTIWKCANDAVRLNLVAQAEREHLAEGGTSATFHPKDYVFSYVSKYQRMVRRYLESVDMPPAFTFVREPTGHFVSGITEFYWRANRREHINATRLKDDLLGFFDMRILHDHPAVRERSNSKVKSYELKHFSAMSGVLKQKFNLTFVGKLESFDDDWLRMNRMYGFNIQLNRTLGVHQTSKDPNGVKAAFDKLFANEPKFIRAFCQLLMVDYVCFDYELPPECSDMKVNVSLL
jgi:hypothetical protein